MISEDTNFGSRTIMEGCDADFLDKLPAHLLFIREFCSNHGITLHTDFKQLTDIEEFVAINRRKSRFHTRDFFQGLVAHCGELLRVEVSGQWKMNTSQPSASYPKERYFPLIVDAVGQEYPFSAGVEHQLAYLLNPELNWDAMDGLYYTMLFQLTRKADWLPVKKNDNWFFPPLDEAAETE